MVICPYRDCPYEGCSHREPHKPLLKCTSGFCPEDKDILSKKILCISEFEYKMRLAIKREETE